MSEVCVASRQAFRGALVAAFVFVLAALSLGIATGSSWSFPAVLLIWAAVLVGAFVLLLALVAGAIALVVAIGVVTARRLGLRVRG